MRVADLCLPSLFVAAVVAAALVQLAQMVAMMAPMTVPIKNSQATVGLERHHLSPAPLLPMQAAVAVLATDF
jgi:hypothetical protein